MKNFFICLILFFVPLISAQTESDELASEIREILTDSLFNRTTIAIDVYDLTDRKFLFKQNEELLLHPASNMKIFSSAAALMFLDTGYTFQTNLYYTGKILNNILYGDLYFKGGFDPDFNSSELDYFLQKFLSDSIKEITGNIYADVTNIDSLFWGNGWMWDDDPSTDAPYLTSLNINDNSIGIIIKGSSVGEPAKVFLEEPNDFIDIINETVSIDSSENDSIIVTRDWINRKNTVIVKGTVKQNRTVVSDDDIFRINIFKPEEYFIKLFSEYLNNYGVKFNGSFGLEKLPEFGQKYFTFYRSLDSVLINLNKTSDNLSAEMIVYALSDKFFDLPATTSKGLKLIDSLIVLAGRNPNEYRIVDGSGVSHYNLVSADLIVSVLNYLYFNRPELFDKIYNSFPIAGIDGTLENRMKNTDAEGNVHAKTGTLSGVSALSGYLTADNDHLISFSILIQNFVGASKKARDIQDKICNLLVNFDE